MNEYRIRERAYRLWQARLASGSEGSAEQDWLAAEIEILADEPTGEPVMEDEGE